MSGTFTSTIASYLFLDLSWSVLSQDIANNRSRVRLELKLRHTGNGVYFSASKSGVLQGSSFTYTGGFSGTGTRTLQTRDIWIDHNSDGSKTQSISGSFNIAITYSGAHRGNTSVSGNITLPTIPRASSLNSFSIGSALKPSTANSVSLSISRASTSFTHDIQLRDGTTVIASWNGQGLPTSLNLSASQVNTLLSRMSNVTSKSLTLRVQTKSGSTNIGGAVSRNATASVDSSVTPNATGLSVSINGTGRDSARSKYIQNISRVTASFNASATGGATVSSRSIVVRQNTTKGNSMTINSNSGTTGVVTQSGTYEAIATVRDSRGRTTTQRVTFTVHAYSPPAITTFTADRNSATPTTVNISRAGNFTPLGTGDNTLTIVIQKSANDGATWTSVQNTSTTSSTFSGTVNNTGNSVTSSYQFRIVITDSFNNSAEATATVSTQRVVLDVHKNEGVGIGKLHERGVLDVDGEAYFNGDLYVNGVSTTQLTRLENVIPLGSATDDIAFWTSLPQGNYFVRPNSIPNQPTNWGIMQHMAMAGESNTIWYGQPSYAMWRKSGNMNSMTDWILVDRPDRGSNSNGNWVRFEDGTQICWARRSLTYTRAEYIDTTWNYPISFNSAPVLVASGDASWISRRFYQGNIQTNTTNGNAGSIRIWHAHGDTYSSGDSHPATMIAIGRWK